MTDSKMPERIWASAAKQGYGEWQDVVDGLPRPTEYIRADLAHPAPVADAELEALVAQARTGIQTKTMTMYEGETVDLVATFNLQMRLADAITALRARTAQQPVSGAVTGSTLVFEPGHLRVNKDGSGYFCVPDAELVFEDDRVEGPDGPEGSVHWIARMDASEITALRDFLNGVPPAAPRPVAQFLAPEDGEFNGNSSDDAQPVGVRVKPLEWMTDPDNEGDFQFWRAKAGEYIYEVGCDRTYWWQEDGAANICAIDGFPSGDAAKAAAQADYEQRIFSALLPEGGA